MKIEGTVHRVVGLGYRCEVRAVSDPDPAVLDIQVASRSFFRRGRAVKWTTDQVVLWSKEWKGTDPDLVFQTSEEVKSS